MSTNSKKGKIYKSEKIITIDKKTGKVLWQMTNYPANHSNLYYMKQSFTPDNKHIIVLSCRTGYSNLFQICLESGEILQLTDYEQDIPQLPPCLSPDGELVYYTLANKVMSIKRSTLEEKILAEFPDSYPGLISMSNDGSFIVTRLNPGQANVRGQLKRIKNALKPGKSKENRLVPSIKGLAIALYSRMLLWSNRNYRIISIFTNDAHKIKDILDIEESGITMLSPDSKHILIHKLEKEIWCCDLSGQNLRHIYGKGTGNWITHPNWLSNYEIVVVAWPHSLMAVNLNGTIRIISKFNFRHPSVSPDGKTIACDTTLPDTGLYAIDVASGKKEVLCYPESSEQKQWLKTSPPSRMPFLPFFIRDQFGSEWEHTHQSFSPDGKMIIFNSTRGGKFSQIFVAHI